MTWRECRLGDVMRLQRGHDLPADKRQDGEVPVVSSSGITGFHDEAKAQPPGVVTGRYGTLGEVYFLDRDYWPLNTALYVTDFKGNDPKFTAYFLKHVLKDYQSDKAAVPGVDRNVLHEIKVRAPDTPHQKRIARALSAYDDLIDNNRRRNKLLEDSVRLLFDEWFVRMRIPGHEAAVAMDGLPSGWSQTPLGSSVSLNYGKALKAEQRNDDGDVPVYGSSGIVGTHDKALAPGPGIIVGRKGNVGSVYWCNRDFFAIDTVFFVNAATSDLYLYYALKNMHFMSTDVAVPGLNRDFACSRPLVSPAQEVRARFLGVAGPVHAQIDKLTEMNQKLRAARDLLLPRLMSGALVI